jgi:hypothetical protein
MVHFGYFVFNLIVVDVYVKPIFGVLLTPL